MNQFLAIGAAVLLVVEQILPHLPCRANSTVQLIVNIAKSIFNKGA